MSLQFGNYYYFLWIFYFLCFVPQKCLQSVQERKLYSDLFKSYTSLERPVINNDEKIILRFDLTLIQILKVNVLQEVLVTAMWLNLEWKDANLQWNVSDYGNLTHIRVPPEKMWTPDIFMYNSADDGFDATYRGTNVIVKFDGVCSYIPPGTFRSICKIDTTWFPFDEQLCEMKFGSWSYDGNHLDLKLKNEDGVGDLGILVRNSEWEVKSFTSKRDEIVYACCSESYVDVTFLLHIRRRSDQHIYNVILPCGFAALCGLLVFVLPPDSGSKLTFGIATIALLYICQSNFSEFRTPNCVPLIDRYFSCLFILLFLSLVSSVFVLNVHHRTSKMPKYIRSLFMERLPYFLLLTKYRQSVTAHQSPSVDLGKELNSDIGIVNGTPENASLILIELQKISQKFLRDESVEQMKNDWKFLAIVLDRIFLVIFATFFLITTITAWTSYSY